MRCMHQGPRSNFEIGGGGGGTISNSILGGRHFFLLNLRNFKNIGGRGHVPCQHAVNTSSAEEVLAEVSDWDCNTN